MHRPRSVYPRSRAVTACQACRERKKKCDNGRPSCGSCARLGSVCHYIAKDASTFDAASLAILDRLFVIESLIRHEEPPSISPLSEPQVEPPTRTEGLPLTTSAYLADLRRANTDTVLSWPAFEPALVDIARSSYLDNSGTRQFSYLCEWSESTTSTVGRLCPFSTEPPDVERLVNAFFQNVHTKNPILDHDRLTAYCNEMYEHGLTWNLPTCLVLLCCALGAISRPWNYDEGSSNSLELGHAYFSAAEKRFGTALNCPEVISVQCLCLAGIYCMYTLKPIAAMRMFSAAGTTLQFILSTTSSDPSLSNCSNVIQRLFWTCFKSEREILAEIPIGHLAITNFQLCETYPLPPESSPEASPPQWQQIQENSWYYYLSEIALRHIADRIVATMYPEHESFEATLQLVPDALEFERQLLSWFESLPSCMAFPLSPGRLDDELKYFLRSRFFIVSELLHRPFLNLALHKPDVGHETIDLARKSLVPATSYLLQSNHIHRHHGKWLQVRRELTYACILLAASELSSVRGVDLMPPGWREGVSRAHDSIQRWSTECHAMHSYQNVISAVDSYFTDRDGQASGVGIQLST